MSDTPAPPVAPDHPTLLPALPVSDPDGDGRAPRTTRGRIIDVLAFGLAVATAVLVYWLLSRQHRAPGDVHNMADIAFTLLACAALWWRRWPVAIAVAIALGGLFSAYSAGAAGRACAHRPAPPSCCGGAPIRRRSSCSRRSTPTITCCGRCARGRAASC